VRGKSFVQGDLVFPMVYGGHPIAALMHHLSPLDQKTDRIQESIRGKLTEVKIMKIQAINEKQFAEAVGLSYGYVKLLRRKGEIKCLRVGRKVLYRYPDHVEIFLREREQATH